MLFDVESGAVRQRLAGHAGDVNAVAFDPDGGWLVTGGDDGQIIRWSVPTASAPAKQLKAWEASTPVYAVAINRDGRLWQPAARTRTSVSGGPRPVNWFAVSKDIKVRLRQMEGSRSVHPENVSRVPPMIAQPVSGMWRPAKTWGC